MHPEQQKEKKVNPQLTYFEVKIQNTNKKDFKITEEKLSKRF